MNGMVLLRHLNVWAPGILIVFSLSISRAADRLTAISTNSESTLSPSRPAFKTGPLSLGITYLGAGIRSGIAGGWGVEARFSTGQERSDDGTVQARFASARVSKHFPGPMVMVPYGVFEGGWAWANRSSQKAVGKALGFAGGIEIPIGKKFSVTLEMGPYYVDIKDKDAGGQESATDLVINSTVYWRIF